MYKISKFFIFVSVLFTSCISGGYSPEVKKALKLAGDNRLELEKVLEHYSKSPADSLKLQAAEFLIGNMPGHYSIEDTLYIQRYYNEVDSIHDLYKDSVHNIFLEAYKTVSDRYNTRQLNAISDIRCITSAYLIDNIDRSFELWQQGEWATHLNFEDFCEYILPYKCIEFQSLDNWKEYAKPIAGEDLELINYCSMQRNLAFSACNMVNQKLKEMLSPSINISQNPISLNRLRSALKMRGGTCDDYAFIATSVLRSKGIPVAIDYTPQWPFRSWGHTWNVLLDNYGKNVIFLGCDSYLGMPHKEDHTMAKVFRKSYAINKDIEKLHQTEKQVPVAFHRSCIKDVSGEYMRTYDVEIKITRKTEQRYAYLAVFDNQNWIPVHWGKISRNKVIFEKMGSNITYLPVCYNENGTVPVANPFILTSTGKIKEIKADTQKIEGLNLLRKYMVTPNVAYFYRRLINARIQASNNPDFNNPVTLYTIQQAEIFNGEILLDSLNKPYRYWRYFGADGTYSTLAELYFFEKGNPQPVYGKIIGSEGSFLDIGNVKEFVFDKNPLSCYDGKEESGTWVGMDFGKPVNIEKIYYTPRGDGNTIIYGDEYELMYWNNCQWNSLGRKIADNPCLVYEKCPSNALFLLHNRTTGVEERIFTYENGKQVWW
jgi:hypothetical protein